MNGYILDVRNVRKMSLPTAIEGTIIGKIVGNLQKSEPKTTIIGAVLGVSVWSQVDWNKLLQKDPTQIALVITGLLLGVQGYWTNHKDLIKNEIPSSVDPPK
jgi:hypothetical protein